MTDTRINVVGIDSNDTRWFWQKESQSWNLYAHLATNFPTRQIAESAAGRIRSGERLKDPEDRMDTIFVKEVS